MKVSLEDLERLKRLDKKIEEMFDEKGIFKITATNTFSNVLDVGQELLWLSSLLYKLLSDITQKYENSVERTIKILDRINSRLKK
jgi:hypothetical protein